MVFPTTTSSWLSLRWRVFGKWQALEHGQIHYVEQWDDTLDVLDQHEVLAVEEQLKRVFDERCVLLFHNCVWKRRDTN